MTQKEQHRAENVTRYYLDLSILYNEFNKKVTDSTIQLLININKIPNINENEQFIKVNLSVYKNLIQAVNELVIATDSLSKNYNIIANRLSDTYNTINYKDIDKDIDLLNLAKSLYETYVNSATNDRTKNNEKFRDWYDLPDHIRENWCVVALNTPMLLKENRINKKD